MKRNQKGFSLIELLIVVAIILIIAAIAIPNLLRARIAANEASAVGSIRSVVTAEVSYSSTWGVGFAAAIANLGGALPCTASSTTACILDPIITVTGIKSGYKLTATGAGGAATATNPNTSFETAAVPVTVGTTGRSGVVSGLILTGGKPSFPAVFFCPPDYNYKRTDEKWMNIARVAGR